MAEQTCEYCGTTATYRGWDGLCDRSCFHALRTLLDTYENTYGQEPDQRIVKYFLKYPKTSHAFTFEKLKMHLMLLKLKIAADSLDMPFQW